MRQVLSALVIASAISVVAMAGSAHFVGVPTITQNGEDVFFSGKVAGLGNVPQIDVTVSGFAECVNPGSNKPSASNKEAFTAQGSFPVQNGKALFQLALSASFQPDCTPPMTAVWSDLRITVTATDGTFLTYP